MFENWADRMSLDAWGASLLLDVPGAPFQMIRLPIASSDGANIPGDLPTTSINQHYCATHLTEQKKPASSDFCRVTAGIEPSERRSTSRAWSPERKRSSWLLLAKPTKIGRKPRPRFGSLPCREIPSVNANSKALPLSLRLAYCELDLRLSRIPMPTSATTNSKQLP